MGRGTCTCDISVSNSLIDQSRLYIDQRFNLKKYVTLERQGPIYGPVCARRPAMMESVILAKAYL